MYNTTEHDVIIDRAANEITSIIIDKLLSNGKVINVDFDATFDNAKSNNPICDNDYSVVKVKVISSLYEKRVFSKIKNGKLLLSFREII